MLMRDHGSDGSLILNELGLCQGETRVDVAVVNGELSGYEIKSASDTLERFPHQQELYSQVLDRAWLVSTPTKIEQVKTTLPSWWGLIATGDSEDVVLTVARTASFNPDPDPFSVAQLLWRDETLELLRVAEANSGVASKPREVLWQRLTEEYTSDQLREAVRTALKKRVNWRLGRRRSRGGAKFPVGARFLASLETPIRQRNQRCSDPLD